MPKEKWKSLKRAMRYNNVISLPFSSRETRILKKGKGPLLSYNDLQVNIQLTTAEVKEKKTETATEIDIEN